MGNSLLVVRDINHKYIVVEMRKNMFKVTIKLDREKVEEQNLDYDKVMALVDQVYDRPEIIKTGEGRYTGITSSKELASFGVAMLTLERTDWRKRWI